MKKNPELTKRKMKEAFLELYEVKRIENISIGEIAQRAGIYRGTFYYYYNDIYDLFAQIEKEMLDYATRVLPQLIEAVLSGRMAEAEHLLNELVQDKENLLQLFFVKKPDYKLLKSLKKYAKATALRTLGLQEEELPDEIAYFTEYIASAQLGLLTMWLENRRNISTEELVSIMTAANLRGPMTYLLEFAKKEKDRP